MKKMFFCVGFIVFLLAFIPVAYAQIGGGEGWITIQCNVNGASVSFDGQYQGMISANQLTVPVYTTGTPYRTWSVEMPGYYSASGTIVMPEPGQTRTYTATLQPIPTQPPAPEYGSIYVESSPSGAAIYLNGNYRGTAPMTINDVRTGRYSIDAELSGYYTYSTTTNVYAGSQSNVFCPLTKIVSSGSLYITSDPSNAYVYLDGVARGRTPITLNNLASGEHTVDLDLSGYYDWKSGVNVPAGGTRTVSATLSQIPSGNTGWIYVSSSPAGATVQLDGNNAGQTPATGTLQLNAVSVGTHTVSLRLSGYQGYTTSVNVHPNTVSQVNAVLVPAGSVTIGSLAVSSTPAGTNVYIDNVFRGVTPLTLNDVTSGTHSLLLQLAGYQDYASTVQVNTGATNTVAAVMNPVPTPTQKSAPLPIAVVLALGLIGLLVVKKRI